MFKSLVLIVSLATLASSVGLADICTTNSEDTRFFRTERHADEFIISACEFADSELLVPALYRKPISSSCRIINNLSFSNLQEARVALRNKNIAMSLIKTALGAITVQALPMAEGFVVGMQSIPFLAVLTFGPFDKYLEAQDLANALRNQMEFGHLEHYRGCQYISQPSERIRYLLTGPVNRLEIEAGY